MRVQIISGTLEAIFDQIECRFLQNRLASYVSRTKRKKNWVPKFFWAAGEAFFSDLGHFSEFEDFSKFEDFGCLKHITLANHHTAVMKERLTLCSSQKHVLVLIC